VDKGNACFTESSGTLDDFDLYTRQHGLETNLFLAPGEDDVVEEAK
jgi:hypothetical protein